MQRIMEPAFEILYLLVGLVISLIILAKASGRKSFVVFGIMGLLLVFGDAFHLVPRMLNAWGVGGENIVAYLGIGKLVTSITMTVFYVLLFWFFRLRYGKKTHVALDVCVYALATVRIVLCALPMNEWTSADAPYLWGIWRNIPFFVLGVLMVVLAFIWAKENGDKRFSLAWLAITLSFAFYAVTVVGTKFVTALGMMMIPKTVCYVWLLVMGLVAVLKEKGEPEIIGENNEKSKF